MKVLYGEGLAPHTGSESCVAACKGCGEALTGERAGRVLSLENDVFRSADAIKTCRRQHPAHRYREMGLGSAWSKTSCMHGSTSHGSREAPRSPVEDGFTGRIVNPKGARR